MQATVTASRGGLANRSNVLGACKLSNHGPTAASAPMKLLARRNLRRRRPRAER